MFIYLRRCRLNISGTKAPETQKPTSQSHQDLDCNIYKSFLGYLIPQFYDNMVPNDLHTWRNILWTHLEVLISNIYPFRVSNQKDQYGVMEKSNNWSGMAAK